MAPPSCFPVALLDVPLATTEMAVKLGSLSEHQQANRGRGPIRRGLQGSRHIAGLSELVANGDILGAGLRESEWDYSAVSYDPVEGGGRGSNGHRPGRG